MSTNKYVEQTLIMPSNLPLFNYNINFEGLRKLIESLNIQANSNTEEIKAIKEQLATKLHSQKLHEQEQMLNNSFRLGINSEKIITDSETTTDKMKRKDQTDMSNMESFGWKMIKLSRVVEDLVNKSAQHHEKIHTDDSKHQKNIDDSFRRIDQRVQSSLESMSKNMNLYFSETNKKLAALQIQLSSHKRETGANFQTLNNSLNQKVSDVQLKAAMNGMIQQVRSSILTDLSDDNMKRLTTLNEYSNKFKEHIKQSEMKIKAAKQTVQQLADKVAKSLPLQTFEIEKHKIFERLGQFKNKIDDLQRKNQQFVDFRRGFYESSERTKHSMLEMEEQIKKLGEKGSSFKKIQDIGSLLQNLDPHLICEISSQVKLHEKEIGKLEKQVIYLSNELQSAKNNSNKIPEINNGQNADLIMKVIKQYMTNLDFEGRVKRAQKQLHDLSQKNNGVNELEKKLYMMTKDIDVGAIMKQIKKKSDDQSTKRDFKVIDSKIESLFQFYKQMRRDLEEIYKKSNRSTKQTGDNASLTTKKLYSPFCLSCTHENPRPRPQSSRNYRRNKMDVSFDSSGIEQIRNSIYVRGTN